MSLQRPKIAIVSTSLGTGGAERFAGSLAIILEELHFEVHHIIVTDSTDFHFSGRLLNLDKVCNHRISILKKIKKGIILYNYLNENKINIIIDNRTRNIFIRELLAQCIFGTRKKYAMIHNFKINKYLPESVFFAKLLYSKTTKLICVSKEIEQQVISKYGFKNTQTIYNSFNVSKIETEAVHNLPEKFILFFGRLDEKAKNISLMLESFSASEIINEGYKLIILGDGPDVDLIRNKIEAMRLTEDVVMIPYTVNPFIYVKSARFTMLTSNFEGFPMSIIESLALGTPVVAVDCNSGPREIIQDKQNGLLVENYNVIQLANALKTFIVDEELYQTCKNNAVKSVQHLTKESISKQWLQLLQED
jgi:glycosyltransferase involved in cell wall biosynthesis